MTTTDTRIAELLGWEVSPSGGPDAWIEQEDGDYLPTTYNFTTDLNLTVREIERKGWRAAFRPMDGEYEAWIENEDLAWPEETYAKSAPEALALAFLAALEAEKEGV